jgi:uncharacterized protein (DUF433 family)
VTLNPDNLILAFSEDHVEHLTGISKSQLRYWDRTGFFVPAFAAENRRVAFSRIYSFRDVASLRVLNILRNQYGVPLQHLRKVARKLSHLAEDKWTKTTLWVWKRKVIFQDPDTEKPREVASGQYLIDFPLEPVIAATHRDVNDLLQLRPETSIGRVAKSRNVSHNEPVIAGTRIPVRAIKRFADEGYSVEQILEEYPSLAESDVRAALKHKAA